MLYLLFLWGVKAATPRMGLAWNAPNGIYLPIPFLAGFTLPPIKHGIPLDPLDPAILIGFQRGLVCDFIRKPARHLAPIGKAPAELRDLCGRRIDGLRRPVTLALPFVGILVLHHSVVRRQQSQQPR